MPRTTLTHLRRNLTRLLPIVTEQGDRLVIWRHRTPIAAIVPMEDYDKLWSWDDEDLLGPLVDPGRSARRKGARWVKDTGWTPTRPPLKARPPEAGGPEPEAKRWWWW